MTVPTGEPHPDENMIALCCLLAGKIGRQSVVMAPIHTSATRNHQVIIYSFLRQITLVSEMVVYEVYNLNLFLNDRMICILELAKSVYNIHESFGASLSMIPLN